MSPRVTCPYCGEHHPSHAAELAAECCPTKQARALEKRLLKIYLPEPALAASTPSTPRSR